MIRTFVINLSKDINFKKVDIFAYKFINIKLLSFHSLTESFDLLLKNIEFELSLENYPNWQAVFIISPNCSINNSTFSTLTSIVQYIQEGFVEKCNNITPLVKFIVIDESNNNQKPHIPLDMYGDYLAAGKLKELCNNISNKWEIITSYPKSDIVISNGFQGIDNNTFKNKIENTINDIKSDFKKYLIDPFENSSNNLNICYTPNKNTLINIENNYMQYLNELKDIPKEYEQVKPELELKKILKQHIGIFSKDFKLFKFFFFDHSEVITPNEELAVNTKIILFIIFILNKNETEELNHTHSEILININNEGIRQSLSKYYFSLKNSTNIWDKKINNKKVELHLQKNVPPISNTNIEDKNHDEKSSSNFPDGLFHSNKHAGQLDKYFENIDKRLEKYIKNIDKNIKVIYENMIDRKNENEIYSEDILDIFKYVIDQEKIIKQKTDNISFPEIKYIMGEWNDFIIRKKNEATSFFNKLPHKRFALIVLSAGVFIFSLSLLFIHLPITIQLLWFAFYIVASTVIFYISLLTLKKPINLIKHEIQEKETLVREEHIKYKNKYLDYLKNIQDLKTLRQNYNIAKKEKKKKTIFFKKCKYHINHMQACMIKSEEILKAFNSELDTELDSKYLSTNNIKLDVNKPYISNDLYNILSDEYTSNDNNNEKTIQVNGNKKISILAKLVDEINFRPKQ